MYEGGTNLPLHDITKFRGNVANTTKTRSRIRLGCESHEYGSFHLNLLLGTDVFAKRTSREIPVLILWKQSRMQLGSISKTRGCNTIQIQVVTRLKPTPF